MLKRSALLALFIFALAFSAFSAPAPTSAQQATNTPPPTPTPVVADTGSGSVKITYWNGLTGGDGGVMQKMVDAFVKDNPGIAVHSEAYVWDVMFQKLTAAFVAGEAPDVFVLHTAEIPQFAELGILRPSDDMFDTNGGTLPFKDFAGIQATKYKDKYYGVLFDNHGFGTWVNLNLFKTAGVDENTPAPKKADEFIKLATKLTLDANGKHPDDPAFDVKNVTQWGTAIDWARVQFESFLPQFGGTLVSSDGKKATINGEGGKAALQFMVDMIYKYHIAPDPSAVNGYNGFQAGQNIPDQLYEAARIDGAGRYQLFTSITLPLLRPTLLFVTVTGFISHLQVFGQPYIMPATGAGGPGTASYTVILYLWQMALRPLRMGYGSAVAVSLAVLIVLFTLVQFRLLGRQEAS